MKNNKCIYQQYHSFSKWRKKRERESVQHPFPPLPFPRYRNSLSSASTRKGWRDRLVGQRSRWVENLFRRVFRMRTVTEHDLRAENREVRAKSF